MSKTGIFETNIRKFIPADESEWSKSVVSLVSTAYDIDQLRERCARDARDIASSFEKFSRLVEEGQYYSEPSPQPHYELTRNMAFLQAQVRLFRWMIQGVLPAESQKDFWEMNNGAFEFLERR